MSTKTPVSSIPPIVSAREWRLPGKDSRQREKMTRAPCAGRGTPPVADGPNRKEIRLRRTERQSCSSDLFEGRRQLILYRQRFPDRFWPSAAVPVASARHRPDRAPGPSARARHLALCRGPDALANLQKYKSAWAGRCRGCRPLGPISTGISDAPRRMETNLQMSCSLPRRQNIYRRTSPMAAAWKRWGTSGPCST